MAALRSADVIVHAGDLSRAAFSRSSARSGRRCMRCSGTPTSRRSGAAPGAARRRARRTSDRRSCTSPALRRGGRRGSTRGSPAATPSSSAIRTCPSSSGDGGTWLLNPGSPTERRRAPFHSMIVVRVGGGELFPELVARHLTRTSVRSSMANTCSGSSSSCSCSRPSPSGLAARSSHGAGPERHYVVKPTDTLWSIAARTYAGDSARGRLEARAAEPPRARRRSSRGRRSCCPG